MYCLEILMIRQVPLKNGLLMKKHKKYAKIVSR